MRAPPGEYWAALVALTGETTPRVKIKISAENNVHWVAKP